MNGIVTKRCCCSPSCCSVTGPAWANRYCFQMSGYEATYEWKECRGNFVDPVYGSRKCFGVPEQGADTDAECEQNSAVCHRRLRQTASAAGAVFRGGIQFVYPFGCCEGCQTTCPDGPLNDFGDPSCWSWFDINNQTGARIHVGVCDKPTWIPPNVQAIGCDSNYGSPPCNCEIAENDRALVRGVVQDLDLTGNCEVQALAPDGLGVVCVAMDEIDEPYECNVIATIQCATDSDLCPIGYHCQTGAQPGLVRHYFKIEAEGLPDQGGPDSDDCPSPFDPPCIGPTSFVFEADLGPNVPPDLAEWRCIQAPVYCASHVCDDPDCGTTWPADPCGRKACEDWNGCYTVADDGPPCNPQQFECLGCDGPATVVLPTLTFLPYQNCVFPEGA